MTKVEVPSEGRLDFIANRTFLCVTARLTNNSKENLLSPQGTHATSTLLQGTFLLLGSLAMLVKEGPILGQIFA